MAKELKRITVETIPNGYSLTVDGNKYMYFTAYELLEGFMYHVGLEELEATDRQTIKEFLSAAFVWRADDEKVAQKMVSLQKENALLQERCKNQVARIKEMSKRLKERTDEYMEDNSF